MKRAVELVDEVISVWRSTPEILIIDDDPGVLMLLRDALGRIGCNLTLAESGELGLAYFARNCHSETRRRCLHPFDMVFLDLKLPGASGPVILRAIKQLDPSQPVAIITGHASSFDLVELAAIGYIGFVRKPFTLDGLEDALLAHNLKLGPWRRDVKPGHSSLTPHHAAA